MLIDSFFSIKRGKKESHCSCLPWSISVAHRRHVMSATDGPCHAGLMVTLGRTESDRKFRLKQNYILQILRTFFIKLLPLLLLFFYNLYNSVGVCVCCGFPFGSLCCAFEVFEGTKRDTAEDREADGWIDGWMGVFVSASSASAHAPVSPHTSLHRNSTNTYMIT